MEKNDKCTTLKTSVKTLDIYILDPKVLENSSCVEQREVRSSVDFSNGPPICQSIHATPELL